MELQIKDRLYIPTMLKQQGSFLEYNLKKSILNKVSLTEEDKEKFHIEEDKETKSIKWDAKTDVENPLTVDFSKEELSYLKESCEKIAEAPYPDDFWVCVERIYNEAK